MLTRIPHSHRAVLAAVPLFVVFAALWVSSTQGPSYVGENSDPDYVYALNALNIIALRSPIHIDHPGTPLQTLLAGVFVVRHAASCLTGDCRSVIQDVLHDPELYLNFAKLFLLGMLAGALLYVGRRAHAASGSLAAAVALQGVIFLFPVTITSLARVTPEPLLMVCSLLYILPFFELACVRAGNGEVAPQDAKRWAIVAGVAFAAGVTSKITFFPLVAMVLLFPTWRDRFRFAAAAAVAGVIFILPIAGRLALFGEWLKALLTHKGMYGGGAVGMPGWQELAASAKNVLASESFLPVWIASLFVFAIFIPRIRKPLLVAALCSLLQFAIVLKHPGARYLLPSFAAVAFGVALVLVQGGRTVRIAAAALVVLSLYPNWRIVSQWAEKRRLLNTSVSEIQRTIASAGSCQVIGFYWSSDVVSNLLFGDEYTQGLHAPLLQSLYPNATRYQSFGGRFHGWAGVDRTSWLLDQLRAGRCIFLQGSAMVESAWPVATGVERTGLLATGDEKLFLLSLPGIPIQPRAAAPGTAQPAAVPSTALPVSSTAAPSAPGTITFEAEKLASGNAVGDNAVFGPGIGVLTTPKVPAFAEYSINIPANDNYEIFARYATEGPRPVSLLLNGKLLNKQFCGNPTGGYYPSSQRWFPGGVFNLAKGKLAIRLESDGPFPHIDKIALVPMRSPK
ncbi:MAG: hypothetical protein ACKV2U_29005 [Bryobacteraceae bacterium]